jgi:ABC-type glycerol-3-phosphate transport system permease component
VKRSTLLSVVGLSALAVLFVAPLVWMISTSLKTDAEAISSTPSWIPAQPTLDGYTSILRAPNQPVLRRLRPRAPQAQGLGGPHRADRRHPVHSTHHVPRSAVRARR